ncbi:MAG: hypothetical protein Q7N50_02535 [Armatimonadota bacterium]|nr:hypothetical protein [Armatimonadota bacterium]
MAQAEFPPGISTDIPPEEPTEACKAGMSFLSTIIEVSKLFGAGDEKPEDPA